MSSLRQALDRPERGLHFDCRQVILKAREGSGFEMLRGQELSNISGILTIAAQHDHVGQCLLAHRVLTKKARQKVSKKLVRRRPAEDC